MIASTTEYATISRLDGGLTQLRRRWAADEPRAAMLLVHGIGEHSGRYDHVGSAFAGAGIDVLAPDLRGFGRSGGRRADVNAFDEFLDDVETLLDERRTLDVPTVLMGHSLGGLIVTNYLVSERPQPDLAVLSRTGAGRRPAPLAACARSCARHPFAGAEDPGRLRRQRAVTRRGGADGLRDRSVAHPGVDRPTRP